MNAHTPEPWRVTTGAYITAGERTDIAGIVLRSPFAAPLDVGKANAARIVAAVNACAGLADPAATLEAVRELLRKIIATPEYDEGQNYLTDTMLEDAEKALKLLTPTQP